jgi:hypothetical protein
LPFRGTAKSSVCLLLERCHLRGGAWHLGLRGECPGSGYFASGFFLPVEAVFNASSTAQLDQREQRNPDR